MAVVSISLEFDPGTRKDGGAESQPLVSVPNISGLNPKYLCSVNDAKANVGYC